MSLVRLLCTIALVLATSAHTMCHAQTVRANANPEVTATVQSDKGSESSAVAAEACPMCLAVPFLAAAPSSNTALGPHVIPDGARIHLAVFSFLLTAPPPRA